MKLIRYLQTKFDIPRRKAFDLIVSGKVKVGGSVMDNVGFDVNGDVEVDGYELSLGTSERVIFKFDKPIGVLCSHSDPHYDKTLFDLLPDEIKKIKPLYIVGRLDKESHGLILLTNDGDFVQKMTHPSSHTEKEYEVLLDSRLNDDEIQQMREGMILEGEEDKGRTKKAKIDVIASKKYRIILTEGRNRQIRRMCRQFGKHILDLYRVRIGEWVIR